MQKFLELDFSSKKSIYIYINITVTENVTKIEGKFF
jgi:hypothetical protein